MKLITLRSPYTKTRWAVYMTQDDDYYWKLLAAEITTSKRFVPLPGISITIDCIPIYPHKTVTL